MDLDLDSCTVSFSSKVRPIMRVADDSSDVLVATAGLETFANVIPDEVKNQIDLLPIVGNACVVNVANGNRDAIDTDMAIDIYKSFFHKFINVEHSRKDIIGHIVSVGFSEFDENFENGPSPKILTEEDIIENYIDQPFNVWWCGVLYKAVAKELCDEIVRGSDPTSDVHLDYSFSWELAFKDFVLAVGGKTLKECELVDGEDIRKVYKAAKKNNWKMPDGRELHARLLIGQAVGLGGGITTNPAAEVKGIYAEAERPDDEDEEDSSASESAEISQTQAVDVTISKEPKIMKKIESFAKLSELTEENIAEYSIASLQEVISNEIGRVSKEFADKITAEKAAIEAEKAEKEKIAKSLEESTAKMAELQSKIQKMEEVAAAAELEQKFNERMASLDEGYDLDDAARATIAKDIRGLDDEGFTKWIDAFKVYASKRDKKVLEVVASATQKEIDEKVAAALKAAPAVGSAIPNGIEGDKTLKEKYKAAFNKENLKISV
jgi:hypothetical protein